MCGATWMKEHSMVFVGVRMPDTLPTVFLQQALRLRREVDVPVPCRGFGVLSDDVLACDLHRIHPAADDRGAGDAVEHVVRFFFLQMVDQ